jgi:hypothetical protein
MVGIFYSTSNKSTNDTNAYMATRSTCRSTNISISTIGSDIVEIGIIWIVEILLATISNSNKNIYTSSNNNVYNSNNI